MEAQVKLVNAKEAPDLPPAVDPAVKAAVICATANETTIKTPIDLWFTPTPLRLDDIVASTRDPIRAKKNNAMHEQAQQTVQTYAICQSESLLPTKGYSKRVLQSKEYEPIF